MNVITLPLAHVLIESGRCTGGDDKSLIGKWCFMVDFIDDDGGVVHDYFGTDRAEADRIAVGWARDAGCRIIDKARTPIQAATEFLVLQPDWTGVGNELRRRFGLTAHEELLAKQIAGGRRDD